MDEREARAAIVYRRLLALLPRDFRDRWGDDMEEVFIHRLRLAGHRPWQSAWVWQRALWDVATQAAAVRLRGTSPTLGREGRMSTMWQDVLYAIKGLRSARRFTVTAVCALALGIGAATATYSMVYAVLLRELPYEEPDRLVMVWPEVNGNKAMAALAQAELTSLEQVSGISRWTLTVTGIGDPLEIVGTLVSTNHFDLMGVRPALGRTFRAGDDLPGAAGVVILSHGFWTGALSADPDVLGRVVEIAGAEYDRRTVIGVMPRGYRPVTGDTDVWVPLEGDPALGLEEDQTWYVNERVARLSPGATVAIATQQLQAHARRVQARLPTIFDEDDARNATVVPLQSFIAGNTGDVLWVALGAVSLVLLIACANVSNLLLARGEARLRSLSVRAALGADRGRIARMLLSESCLLGIAGGALGTALAYGLVDVIVRLAPADFPRIDEVSLSGGVLAYALLATVGATLLAGVIPSVRSSRVDGITCLGGSTRGTGTRRAGRLTAMLVGAQMALAVVVAVGAGLMVRSLGELLAVDPGMDGSGVLALKPNPPGGRYPDSEAFQQYYTRVLERLEAAPGVVSVGAIHLLPGTSNNWSFPTFPEGVDLPEGSAIPTVNFRAVRPGYFETVRIPLLEGRQLDGGDQSETEAVVVVNEAFATRFWGDESPLDRSIRIFSRTAEPSRVVGVVGDVRQHDRAVEPRPEMYFPHAQVPYDQMSMWIMARVSTGAPLDHADDIQAAVWEVDPEVPISGVDDLEAILGQSTETTRFLALLLSGFGAFALLLGGIGVFGVTAYVVAQRVPEFGVRIALGSSRNGVLGSALRRGFGPVAAGLAVGLGAAVFSAGLLDSVLYEVTATDPVTFLGVATVLALVALVAILVPAWHASAVDPVAALNSE